MRVLIACEMSGVVRDAFRDKGHEAFSCDILDVEDWPDEIRERQKYPNYHLAGDVRWFLSPYEWDMLIAFPPCTRLCNSGVRWLRKPPKGRSRVAMWGELDQGAALFSVLWNSKIPRICIENPVMHKYAKERIAGYKEPAQTIQPWQFGHPETKRTCLWLRHLPPLQPTNIVDGREPRIHHMSPSAKRGMLRSLTYPGIARAMAEQWG